jgi:hypothetical protein
LLAALPVLGCDIVLGVEDQGPVTTGTVRGSLSYFGPPPCLNGGQIEGAVVVMVFALDKLPPPEGLESTSISFATIPGAELDGDAPDGLDAVDAEQHAGALADLADGVEVGAMAGRVLGRAHGDEPGPRADRGGDRLGRDATLARLDGRDGHAAIGEVLPRIDVRRVLERGARRDLVAGRPRQAFGHQSEAVARVDAISLASAPTRRAHDARTMLARASHCCSFLTPLCTRSSTQALTAAAVRVLVGATPA